MTRFPILSRTVGDSWTIALAVATLSVLSLGLFPSPAVADSYTWRSCTWQYNPGTLTVRHDGSFPPNVTYNGIVNSFTNRISGGISNWNAQLNALSETNNTFGSLSSSNYASGDIRIRYANPSTGQPANAFITSSNGCVLQSTQDSDITALRIDISIRTDWFTQPDSRRAAFEACTSITTIDPCNRRYDFGETITHELGHALGMGEAQDAPQGSTAGVCTIGSSRATMCSGLMSWETARRTPNAYDRESLRLHYAN